MVLLIGNLSNVVVHRVLEKSVKEEIIKRARSELLLRMSKGYTGIELGTIESTLEKLLRELKIK